MLQIIICEWWSWGATPCWTRAQVGGIVNPERPPRLELFSSPHPKPALWQNLEPEPALTLTLAMSQIPWGLQRVNIRNLVEAEEIKKRWKEYMEELN